MRCPRKDSRSCKRSGCSLRIRHMSQKGWTAGQFEQEGLPQDSPAWVWHANPLAAQRPLFPQAENPCRPPRSTRCSRNGHLRSRHRPCTPRHST